MKARNPLALCSLPLSLRHSILRTTQWHTPAEFSASLSTVNSSTRTCMTLSRIPRSSPPSRTSRSPPSTRSTCMTKRNTSTTATAAPSPSRVVRPLVPPPKEGSGPLLSRRPDRELPPLPRRSIWTTTLPLFALLVGVSSFAIFNYQKSSSSTVNAILYALRTNDEVRALLGDEIYFASKIPWIRGELAPLQGNIDIKFWVKGTKSEALVKFLSIRSKADGFFETLEWSLKTKDGRVVQLLDEAGGNDPMAGAKI